MVAKQGQVGNVFVLLQLFGGLALAIEFLMLQVHCFDSTFRKFQQSLLEINLDLFSP